MTRIPLLAASLACVLGACASAPPAATAVPASATATQVEALPNLRTPRAGLLTSAQPAATAWQGLKQEGVVAVVNLRPEAEMDGRDERAEVAAAGMAYHAIPVAGADGLTETNVTRLWELVEGAQGPVLVHCASGNRAGALLALGAARHGGMSAEEALAFGKSAGLTSAALEAAVRERLALPAARD